LFCEARRSDQLGEVPWLSRYPAFGSARRQTEFRKISISGIAPASSVHQTVLALPLLERDTNEILCEILNIEAA